MSLGGLTALALTDRAPDLVRSLVLVDVTPGVNREKSTAIAQFIDGPEYFESFDEILERTVAVQPDAHGVVAAARHPAQRDRGARRPLALALRPPAPRERRRRRRPDHARPRRAVGRGRRACRSRSRWCAAASRRSSTTTTSPSCSAATRPRSSRWSKTPGTACRATSRSSSRAILARSALTMLPELPPAFAATRDALHAVAEQVVSAAYFHATTHIGLRPDAARVRHPGVRRRRARARRRDRARARTRRARRAGTSSRRCAAAAAFVGVPLGAPTVYTPTTSLAPDAPLADRPRRARWRSPTGTRSARALLGRPARRAPRGAVDPSSQIWPEHFDLACELGDADAGHPGQLRRLARRRERSPSRTSTSARGTPPGAPACSARYPFGAALHVLASCGAPARPGAAGRQFFESALAELVG